MRARRLALVGLLAALLVGGAAIGNATASHADAPRAPSSAAALTAAGGDAVWFCPGLPPVVGVRDVRVSIANTGPTPVDAAITVLADKGAATHQVLTIAPNSVLTKPRADIGPAGALTVETFGSTAVVEEGVDGGAGVEIGPCATESSPNWYFAAGDTTRGAQQWLVIEDPFASDAKVDVTVRTANGLVRPDRLQGLDVARRSRVVIPMHDLVVREDRVAVQVTATNGRVVAAQTLVYSGAVGASGVASTIGAPAPANAIWFADGATLSGGSSIVAIANVGEDDADVQVQPLPQNNQPVPATALTLAPDEVALVQLGNCTAKSTNCASIPANVAYSLSVETDRGPAVVAQTLGRGNGPSEPGAVTSLGIAQPGRQWLFARSRVGSEQATTLAFVNPLAQATTVDIALPHDGRVDRPAGLQRIAIPPGRRITVNVVAATKAKSSSTTPAVDTAIIVTAAAPVVVERVLAGTNDSSRSVGVRVG